jgi:hypothetical protein
MVRQEEDSSTNNIAVTNEVIEDVKPNYQKLRLKAIVLPPAEILELLIRMLKMRVLHTTY